MFDQVMTAVLGHIARDALSFDDRGMLPTPLPQPGHRYLLYIHIPFCESLCPFCSFHRIHYDETLALTYFEALRREITGYHERGFRFSEAYVGGGTPTVNLDQLLVTLDLIRSLFGIEQISVETNPNHLRESTIGQLRAAGIKRLSVGVQSFDDGLLARMNRLGPYGSAAQIIERLRVANDAFETLNVDLIFNLPGQTLASIERDLEIVRSLALKQVSWYPLMASNSSRVQMQQAMGEVDFSRERALYERINDGLAGDYELSSVWCFSRDAAMIDEYIINHEQYIGVGSGSFSYLNGVLYATSFSIPGYGATVDRQGHGLTRHLPFSRREQLRYYLMTNLFGLSLSRDVARSRWGPGFERSLWLEIASSRLLGMVRIEDDRLVLTRRGRYYLLIAMREFLTGVNNVRDQMRDEPDPIRLKWPGV
ncbi:MAG: coproporphyrinogen III oxidase family protein [Proteobacteria bacterium]|jgi:coproporphyrinogen III oxidase-like Fe-S oxidoreductase|nr:coproporphyrinogen III oxidase family protein [Pseudomonadota bacterium]MDA1299531.1 coproporphyrinogen III oxidase family protein [Pseudomonadota bacterium]